MTWANNYACTHAENKNFSRKTWHTPVSSNLSKYIWRVRFKALASFDYHILSYTEKKVEEMQTNFRDIFQTQKFAQWKYIQEILASCEFHYCKFHECNFSKLSRKINWLKIAL